MKIKMRKGETMTMLLCRDNAVYRSNSFKFERRAPEDNPKTVTRFHRRGMMRSDETIKLKPIKIKLKLKKLSPAAHQPPPGFLPSSEALMQKNRWVKCKMKKSGITGSLKDRCQKETTVNGIFM